MKRLGRTGRLPLGLAVSRGFRVGWSNSSMSAGVPLVRCQTNAIAHYGIQPCRPSYLPEAGSSLGQKKEGLRYAYSSRATPRLIRLGGYLGT